MNRLVSLNPPLPFKATCCICESDQAQAIYVYLHEKKEYHLLKCHCGHLFIHPIPLIELDARNMDSVEDADFWGNSFLKNLHTRLVIQPEIEKVKKVFNKSGANLLDIGCGTGWTTAIWKEAGFQTIGLESSPVRSKIAKEKYHLDVYPDHLENFKTDQLFDVIIMRHLFEHIEDPVAMLKKIKKFLKPNGILLIVIPNIACIGRYVFRENWEWVLPWHLHFYTPKTLSRLLTKTGFIKIEIYQTPSPLWYPHTLNKAIFGSNPKFKFPHSMALFLSLPIVLLGWIFNLNDNMTLIFRNDR